MKASRTSLFLLLLASAFSTLAAGQENSPHAEAIRLVMQARANEVRRLDQSQDWWADTKVRSWSARRPFGPGTIDSTHYFEVTYSIDGKVVGTWSVNTRTGQVAGPGETIQIE